MVNIFTQKFTENIKKIQNIKHNYSRKTQVVRLTDCGTDKLTDLLLSVGGRVEINKLNKYYIKPIHLETLNSILNTTQKNYLKHHHHSLFYIPLLRFPFFAYILFTFLCFVLVILKIINRINLGYFMKSREFSLFL